MKIAILDGKMLNPGDVDWSPISALGETVIYDTTSAAELRSHAAGADVLLLNKVPLRKSSLKDIPDARFVGALATGYDIVDVAACAERNIPVCNVVAYGVDDVAQHTLTLLLELCRHTSEHSLRVKEGQWQQCGQWCFWEKTPVQLTGLTIAGVTLSPTFSPTTYSYTGGTASSNSAKVEATPAQAGAKVAIAVNGANLRNGGTATLNAGASNTITATVTQGNAVRVYTVTVTGAA